MNEQALKERIKAIAQLENRTFHEIWKLLVLERLLVRLARSKHHDKFVFKGGLLLSYYLFIGRETSDIDLLIQKMKAEMPIIKESFQDICESDLSDGFAMSFTKIVELNHLHMNYPGYRVSLNVGFGKIEDNIQVDIAVGDWVQPKQESLELYRYKGKPIFEGSVSLQVYPIETLFAEKLETVVSRGVSNSRMKDFHDILLLCREDRLMNVETLRMQLEKVFSHRKTAKTIPIVFSDEDYRQLQSVWIAHVRGLGTLAKSLQLPVNISDLVKEINQWLEEKIMISVTT